MIRYVFNDDPLPLMFKNADKANPQVIGEIIEKIGQANDGETKPQAVVDKARVRNNPLHKHFEWDDAIAGAKYRLNEARMIIRCIMVVDKRTESGTARAFMSIKDTDRGGVSYRHIEEVMGSAELTLAVMIKADKELEAFMARYRQLQDICDIIQDARDKIKVRREEVEAHATV